MKRIQGLGLKSDKRWWWWVAALFTWLLGIVFNLNPYFTEVVYSRGIFSVLRYVIDYTIGWLPFASLYLAVPILLWGIWRIYRPPTARKSLSWTRRLGRFFLNTLTLLAAVYTLFYFLWGFNYERRPVEDQLKLPMFALDSAALSAEFELATQEMLIAQAALHEKSDEALNWDSFPDELEDRMRENLIRELQKYGYPTPGRVRGRTLWPNGLLMQLGAIGIYIPFVAEGHVDAALHPLSHTYTLPHEMAHGYGFGDEGTCNFWAYLACWEAKHPAIRYAGLLGYWRSVAGQYRRVAPERYKTLRDDLPDGVKADLEAIYAVLKKYPGFFPKFSDKVYDQYLKNQGISEGLANYSRVVSLVAAWRQLPQPSS